MALFLWAIWQNLAWETNLCPVLYCLLSDGFVGSLGHTVWALLLSWLFYIRRQHWSSGQSGSIYGEYILVHLYLTAYILHIFLQNFTTYVLQLLTYDEEKYIALMYNSTSPKPSLLQIRYFCILWRSGQWSLVWEPHLSVDLFRPRPWGHPSGGEFLAQSILSWADVSRTT